jgi:hypothetical protein
MAQVNRRDHHAVAFKKMPMSSVLPASGRGRNPESVNLGKSGWFGNAQYCPQDVHT